MPTIETIDPSAVRKVVSGLQFCDGIVAMDDGTLLVAELSGTVARIGVDGAVVRFAVDGGGANGLALGPDGAVYVANNGGVILGDDAEGLSMITGGAPGNEAGTDGGLLRLDLETGEIQTVYTHAGGEHIGWLNDIVFDAAGSCYTVDTVRGNVYYADPAGDRITVVASGLTYPNGAGLSPDGTRLYVSETPGDVSVWDVEGRAFSPTSESSSTTASSTAGTGWPSTVPATSAWPRRPPPELR